MLHKNSKTVKKVQYDIPGASLGFGNWGPYSQIQSVLKKLISFEVVMHIPE